MVVLVLGADGGQVAGIEQDEHDDTHAERGIGNVEDGLEEHEVITADHGHPLGPVPLAQREVEHVHDPAVEQGGIAAVRGKQLCHLGRHGIVENQAVGNAVNDIAQCSGGDQCDAGDIALGHIVAVAQSPQVIDKRSRGDDAEQGEQQFAAQFHAEGHAVILDEQQLEPGGDFHLLAVIEMGFYPNLERLVDDDNQRDD